jgi:histidine ammonia-lyase
MLTLAAGRPITALDLVAVARDGEPVALDPTSLAVVAKVAKRTQAAATGGDRAIYGLNTGVGAFAQVKLPRTKLEAFSRNVILSHAAGVGPPFAPEVTRGAMLAQLKAFLAARSGVRPELLAVLHGALNAGVVPVVPEQGSLGASGDLAPQAHLWLVLSRGRREDPAQSGSAHYRNRVFDGVEAMRRARVPRVRLAAKEGLSAVNGTYFMTSLLCLLVADAFRAARVADVAAAMTMEASCAVTTALDPRIHELRPHPGQVDSAANLRALLSGSTIVDSRRDVVQDAYALRCTPQVQGAARGLLRWVREVAEIELNSVTDNPLLGALEPELLFLSGGNFHGEPIGYAADSACQALTGIAGISERRSFRLLDHVMNRGLPDFLVEAGGVHCGLMITSYTAAALVSENKSLSYPASVDSIPSSRNQEDHVSMATIAARKARRVMENTWAVLAIEVLIACQAIDFRLRRERGRKRAPRLGDGTRAAHDAVRAVVPFLDRDRIQSVDIEAVQCLIRDGAFLDAIERALGSPLA